MNPKLVMLEGNEEALGELEMYLGRELTEYDLDNPELMGAWVQIIKGLGKGLKAIGKGIGRRHRRKEGARVQAARQRLILQRRQKRSDYLENLRLRNWQDQNKQTAQVQRFKKGQLNKNILYIGAPLFAGLVYYLMTKD